MARSILAIVGAGPKAAALAARAAVILECGFAPIEKIPLLRVYESRGKAAAWLRDGGFSDGSALLCTPPEMDVGFPYGHLPWEGVRPQDSVDLFLPNEWRAISNRLRERFSWHAFLHASGNGDRDLVDYILRGRPLPSHFQWGEYLDWVFEQAGPTICDIRYGKVKRVYLSGTSATARSRWGIRYRPGRWDQKKQRVVYARSATEKQDRSDAVVLTGTGEPLNVPIVGGLKSPHLTHAGNFWNQTPHFRTLASRLDRENRDLPIAVIGDGGAAAAILDWLNRVLGHNPKVVLYSVGKYGAFFPRGDGHAERRWMVDIGGWESMDVKARRDIIGRIGAGVISTQLKTAIDGARRIIFKAGRAALIEASDLPAPDPADRTTPWPEHLIVLGDGVDINGSAASGIRAAYIIEAAGFDAWQLLKLVFDPGGRTQTVVEPFIRTAIGKTARDERNTRREPLETKVDARLRLPLFEGADLYVPGLAYMRGPGFPNLGCLGLTAARILDPQVFDAEAGGRLPPPDLAKKT